MSESSQNAEARDAQVALTEAQESQGIADRIEEIPASDGAAVMGELTSARAAEVAEVLDPVTAARILSEMDAAQAASVIADMEGPEASMVLAEMDPDDRVDIVQRLPEALQQELLGEMDAPEAAETRALQQYPPDTAGGLMTPQVTALSEYFTVEQAILELRQLSQTLEQMFYVYVIDRREHLVGVLSMRDLILARPDRLLSEIMRPNVVSLPVTTDQEEVARIFRRRNYLAMPVVDDRNRLLGIITVDDVVHVMQDEATEDVQKMFGAGAEERLTSAWSFSFKKRGPWLFVNLGTAFAAAWVVSRFEQTIMALPILAAYQTIVSGMGGNAGAQAMAVAIRGIALGEVDTRRFRALLKREFLVGLCTGLLIGLATALIAVLSNHSRDGVIVGVVIWAALIFNHVNACLTGVAIPFAMKKFGFDPAQSSSIIATTFTDCGGFLATLGLAQLMLTWLK